VWTRFFPLTKRFQELLHKEKAIGDIHYVRSEFGIGFFHTEDKSHRVFNPELGGSAQLDIGPYSVLWGLLALHEHPENNGKEPAKIVASSLPDPRTGVDLFTTIILDYPNLKARAERKHCLLRACSVG
jgi:predicted dehydrogenase